MRHLFLLSLTMLGGCVYGQKLELLEPGATLANPPGIVVEDLRDKSTLKSNMNNYPCWRAYGDTFIAPSKIAYLKHLLGTGSSPATQLQLKLTRFETVEHCEATAARTHEIATAVVVATTTGTPQTYKLLPNAPGDDFVLRIAGEVNGKPFDVTRGFDYSKIAFFNL